MVTAVVDNNDFRTLTGMIGSGGEPNASYKAYGHCLLPEDNSKLETWTETSISSCTSTESLSLPRSPTVVSRDDINSRPEEHAALSVWFDEELNEYHESGVVRSRCEEAKCWYSESEINDFRSNVTRSAQRWLGSSSRRCQPCWSFWPFCGMSEEKQAAAERCRDAIASAYQECALIVDEDFLDSGQQLMDRDSLLECYREIEDLVGLEESIMLGFRGDAGRQVQYILNMVHQRTAGSPKLYHDWMCLMSQCVSLPSRIFVRELALAQAKALQSLDDKL